MGGDFSEEVTMKLKGQKEQSLKVLGRVSQVEGTAGAKARGQSVPDIPESQGEGSRK